MHLYFNFYIRIYDKKNEVSGGGSGVKFGFIRHSMKNNENNNIELENLKPKIIKILKKNKVKKAGIFGSFVRGEQKENSDIDILIEPPKSIGLGFVGIKIELEGELKRKVDLVSYKGINPHLKKYILEEEVRII